jgi:hypothetical protein
VRVLSVAMPSTPPFEYQDRVLVYLDLLGWSQLVQRSKNEMTAKHEVDKAIQKLASFGSTYHALARANPQQYDEQIGVYITQASDSLMISCPPAKEHVEVMLDALSDICTVLLVRARCYARGALVRGPLHHRIDAYRGVVVGPALVDAVELEKAAHHPRIVISPEARSLVSDHWVRSDPADGAQFVDFLRRSGDDEQVRRNCEAALDIVEAKLKSDASAPSLTYKHEWMRRYVNCVIECLGCADQPAESVSRS